jgi:hypothetical protein
MTDDETFSVPLSALSIAQIMSESDQAFYRALPHVPHYRSPRTLKNPELRVGMHLSEVSYGCILDEVTHNILELIWNEEDRQFVIKAEYPNLPVYFKKFYFDEYFLALSFWEEFTFLFYHRLEGWNLKESAKRAKDHRRVVVTVMQRLRSDRRRVKPVI